jgi:vacuolar-type H+-ATPase subunit H
LSSLKISTFLSIMTAFDEVILAEDEAAQAIAVANEETAAAVVAAQTDRQSRLEAEAQRSRQAEQAALAKHQVEIDTQVANIQADTIAKVEAIAEQFATRKSDLKAFLKKSFQ